MINLEMIIQDRRAGLESKDLFPIDATKIVRGFRICTTSIVGKTRDKLSNALIFRQDSRELEALLKSNVVLCTGLVLFRIVNASFAITFNRGDHALQRLSTTDQ